MGTVLESPIPHALCAAAHNGVITQEGHPGLRGWLGLRLAKAFEIPGHRSFVDLEAQNQQLAVDPRRTPERIGLGHETDEFLGLRAEARSARSLGSGLPFPELAKTCFVPFDHRGRLRVIQRVAPVRPESVEYHPEKTIPLGELGLLLSAGIHTQLLPQGQDLNGLMNVETTGGQDET